jgi:hypothetical protein
VTLRLGPILAAALAALALALFALLLVLAPGIGRVSPASLDTGDWIDELPSIVVNVATVLVGALLAALFLLAATHQGPLEAVSSLENPFGLPIPEFVLFIPLAAVQALELLACVSLVLRFVRSRGEERQQIKWVAFGTAAFAVYILLNILFGLPRWTNAVGSAAPLAAITVAVLKYRLYDIDIVINRALVYGALTTSLALVYVGCVVSLQYIFRALTGQDPSSQSWPRRSP